MIRYLSLVALSLALTGCDAIRSSFMDPVEKINAAFPLPQELEQAQAQLFDSAAEDAVATAALRSEYGQLLRQRALACTGAAAIDPAETVREIREKVADTGCFHDYDLALADWVGRRRFVVAVRKPALVPYASLPAQAALPPQPEPTIDVMAASSANVVVLKGAQGRLATLELPSGKTLHSFAAPGQAPRPAMLSPNGCVLAVPLAGNALSMLDTETGVTLWSTPRFKEVTAWLPEVDATLLSQSGSPEPALFDHRSAALQPHPLPLSGLTWSVAIANGKGRQVLGNARMLSVVEHSRGADGAIAAAFVARREVPGQGITIEPPLVMANGSKLVYATGNDLGWLDIESGAEGLLNLSPLNARGFSKNSETTVYLDINTPGPDGGARLLDIEKATLARVRGDERAGGSLAPLGSRDGWARRDRAVTLGHGAVAERELQPIGRVIVDTVRARYSNS